jgi:hypothetical protein
MRLAIGCLVLLAGCAVLKPGYEDSQVVREIVETAVDTLRATPEAQRERLAAAMQVLASRNDDTSRLRAAVLLATLPPPLRDEARAAALVRELTERRPDSPVTQFATLFQARLEAPERASAAADEAEQRLRATEKREQALREQADALRASERTLAEREEALKKRTQALQRSVAEREEAVRRQVEALRESERLMTEREETVRKQIEALRETERSMSEREGRLGTKTR